MDYDFLAQRIRDGLARHQVLVGFENYLKYARGGRLGLIWVTEDLGKQKQDQLRAKCAQLKLPYLIHGDSEEVGAITGYPTTKVYLVKKSFSGLRQILLQLERDGALSDY